MGATAHKGGYFFEAAEQVMEPTHKVTSVALITADMISLPTHKVTSVALITPESAAGL